MNKWRVGKRTSVEWVDGQVDGWVDASMGVCGWAYGQAESGWTDGALTLPGSSSWRGVPVAGRVDSAVLNNLCRPAKGQTDHQHCATRLLTSLRCLDQPSNWPSALCNSSPYFTEMSRSVKQLTISTMQFVSLLHWDVSISQATDHQHYATRLLTSLRCLDQPSNWPSALCNSSPYFIGMSRSAKQLTISTVQSHLKEQDEPKRRIEPTPSVHQKNHAKQHPAWLACRILCPFWCLLSDRASTRHACSVTGDTTNLFSKFNIKSPRRFKASF